MSEFSVNMDNLLNEAHNYSLIVSELKMNQNAILNIERHLLPFNPAENAVREKLHESSVKLTEIIHCVKTMESVLSDTASLYKITEQTIVSNQKTKTENPAFDDVGAYGGNQSNPVTQSDELADLVKKYHPEFTEDEIVDYLTKLESEGCGYVALINTIFQQFTGREEDFEKTFGFPMYGKDGDLNYNAMVTDFYSAMDNHNKKVF